MAGMDKPPEEKRLLFINTNENNFPPRRNQHNSIDSEVRRHVMLDIGKARRKPSKDRQFVTLTWQTQKHTGKQESPKRRHYGHSKTPEECQATISTPTLYALAVFEKEWGEDSFSAYGFTLIMATGKNAMSGTYSANTFWSPFAFRKSAFLKHYQQIFSSPDVLIPLYRRSSLELKSIALERSLMTIQCIESRLASSDTSWATSDSVISAVLALICYNFSNLDFDQAMVHISGIWMVIEARGGISTLENNQDLLLMISWYVRSLSATLSVIFSDSMTEQVTKGDAIWSDEEQMSLLLNPIAHDLLNQQQLEPPKPDTPYAIILESLRLGAIIWIIQVKRRCRSYPGTAQARITTLLRTISNDTEADIPWNCSADLQVVRLWLLVLCSVSEPSGQDYSTLMRIIASEMKELNLWLPSSPLISFSRIPSFAHSSFAGVESQPHNSDHKTLQVSSFIMEDPNLTEAPGAAQCPSSQSAELKDSSGRPHCGQPIAGATPLGTPVGASEDDAESPGSTPLPSSAFKMAGHQFPDAV
uniref:Transcription factor domain-containing protein n=1 Tax=Fusarium oxysporum (strain Fo5176) TaxID=660025 RepID=A0A0D2XCB4_FUSOF